MKNFFKNIGKLSVAAPMFMCVSALPVAAAQITTMQTGHGSGTLNGVSFDSDFVITTVADSDNITETCGYGCFENNNVVAIITIASVGAVNILSQIRYYSIPDFAYFSYAWGSGGADLFDFRGLAWGLDSAQEPVTSTGYIWSNWSLNAGDDVITTTAGSLIFNAGSTVSSFTATASAVPVPATSWLLASGLVGLTGIARRKA